MRRRAAVLALAALLAAPLAPAQSYPERPLRYVIPSAAGGGPDTAARVVMAELGRQLGHWNGEKCLCCRNCLRRTKFWAVVADHHIEIQPIRQVGHRLADVAAPDEQ